MRTFEVWRLLLVTLGLAFGPVVGAQGELQVFFLNVGQGDSTLLISPSGQTLLMDAGDNGEGFATVAPALADLGIDTLDYFVASHYHADHIGGIDEVISAGVDVDVAYDRGGSYTTVTYADYVAAIGPARTTIGVGDVIDLGGGVSVTCVAVNGMILGGGSVPVSGTNQEENARSIALVVEYGEFELFVSGDLTGGGFSTADVESALGPTLGDVEVYRASHHGSQTSSHGPLLGALKPNMVVISLGDGNPFGFPHEETMERLTALPMLEAIYQTELGTGATAPEVVVANGSIELQTSGDDYVVTVPGGAPVTFPVNVNAGDLVINEIMKDPTEVADSQGEWFEIYNRGPVSIDLDGWRIQDDDFDLHFIDAPGGALTIGPGEFRVLGIAAAGNGGVAVDYVYDDFLLGNGADEILLGLLAGGDFIPLDSVRYTDGGFPDIPGSSMEFTDLIDGDNGDGSQWESALTPYGDGDLGTPGLPNSTGVELDALFVRGDANRDGILSLPDPVTTLEYLFGDGATPSCFDAHDANDNGVVGLDDVILSLSYQFSAGDPPPAPFPGVGADPTPDALGCVN